MSISARLQVELFAQQEKLHQEAHLKMLADITLSVYHFIRSFQNNQE
jgi:hypothetical protein